MDRKGWDFEVMRKMDGKSWDFEVMRKMDGIGLYKLQFSRHESIKLLKPMDLLLWHLKRMYSKF